MFVNQIDLHLVSAIVRVGRFNHFAIKSVDYANKTECYFCNKPSNRRILYKPKLRPFIVYGTEILKAIRTRQSGFEQE